MLAGTLCQLDGRAIRRNPYTGAGGLLPVLQDRREVRRVGGIIELFPPQPILEDGGFDHVFGLNFMLPPRFEAQDITGWGERRWGILQASRQLQQGYHLEMARRARRELGERFTLIDPSLLRGVSFYDLFIDRLQWPALIRQGHTAATRALDALRPHERVRSAR